LPTVPSTPNLYFGRVASGCYEVEIRRWDTGPLYTCHLIACHLSSVILDLTGRSCLTGQSGGEQSKAAICVCVARFSAIARLIPEVPQKRSPARWYVGSKFAWEEWAEASTGMYRRCNCKEWVIVTRIMQRTISKLVIKAGEFEVYRDLRYGLDKHLSTKIGCWTQITSALLTTRK
jgi:hypothetical protein